MLKTISLLLLFVGEALAIASEMIGARMFSSGHYGFLEIFLKMLLLCFLGGGGLIAGYMLGYKAFQNIWIVTIASITAILIVEPFLAWIIFRELPTKGAVIGLMLGILGFVATLTVR
ncbi:MAG TPA: hypothetical protein VJB82_01095 [Candidatus Peribacterales bacterium]|nr:hypothetical protein [Candidatus Peribacterales bacterium]